MTLDTVHVYDESVVNQASSKLLAIHSDGTVTCYSHDLGIEEWTTHSSLSQLSAPVICVEFAVVLSLEQARPSVLKGCEDGLASFDLGEKELNGSILLLATRPGPNGDRDTDCALTLQVLYVEPENLEAGRFPVTAGRRLRELISQRVPEPQGFASASSKFSFHAGTATLYQSQGGEVAMYDLNGLSPRLTHKLDLRQQAGTSYLRLSANLIACSTADALSIIELPFLSLQAQINARRICSPSNSGDEHTSSTGVELVSYHASSDVAIALVDRQLFAIQLSTKTPVDRNGKKRKREGELANAIGRGSYPVTEAPSDHVMSTHKKNSLGRCLPQKMVDDSWSDQVAELDRCSSQGDALGFEKSALSLLESGSGEDGCRKSKLANHQQLDQRKVFCILNKIFAVKDHRRKNEGEENDDRIRLKIRLLPQKVFTMLIDNGGLDATYIEKSLRLSGALNRDSKIASGALTEALAEWDTSLESLSLLLASAIPLSSAELVHALSIVTQESNAVSYAEAPKLLRDTGEDDVSMPLTNGETVHAPSSPPTFVRSDGYEAPILASVMKRLYTIPPTSVTRALKSGLSKSQLRILVDALRMEIARSGWLSPYEDSLEVLDPQILDSSRICHIAHLLNCAIDSIGTGGWILGTSMTDDLAETADTIAYMKAEISAALEGIEEATYLKGMLGEILLCGKAALNSQFKSTKVEDALLTAFPTKPLTIALEEVSNALPLGLKRVQGVSTSKVGAGGELLKRSARDIGRQKSKMVGKYSFERIVV